MDYRESRALLKSYDWNHYLVTVLVRSVCK